MSTIIREFGRGMLRSWVYVHWLRVFHTQWRNGCLSCWLVSWQNILMIQLGPSKIVEFSSTHSIDFTRSQFRPRWESVQAISRERIKTPGMRTRSALTKNNLLRFRLCYLVLLIVCCYFTLICILRLSVTWVFVLFIDAWMFKDGRDWK